MVNNKTIKDFENEIDAVYKKQAALIIPKLQTFRVSCKTIDLFEVIKDKNDAKSAIYKDSNVFINDELCHEQLFFNEFNTIIDAFFREAKIEELVLHVDKGFFVVSFKDDYRIYIKALKKNDNLKKKLRSLFGDYEDLKNANKLAKKK